MEMKVTRFYYVPTPFMYKVENILLYFLRYFRYGITKLHLLHRWVQNNKIKFVMRMLWETRYEEYSDFIALKCLYNKTYCKLQLYAEFYKNIFYVMQLLHHKIQPWAF